MAAQRHFLVTIRGDSELDVNDVQDAIVKASQTAYSRDDLDHGNLDVQLIEELDKAKDTDSQALFYTVLDAA